MARLFHASREPDGFQPRRQETKFADSPAMCKALSRCEDAYEALHAMKGYESFRPERDPGFKTGEEK